MSTCGVRAGSGSAKTWLFKEQDRRFMKGLARDNDHINLKHALSHLVTSHTHKYTSESISDAFHNTAV